MVTERAGMETGGLQKNDVSADGCISDRWGGFSASLQLRPQFTGKKKPGNPHLRGPSGFSKPPKMVGRVGFEPTTNWLK
ncbi:hypothetical protein, partial [Pseudomonas synxantha]|uniref:hypothetical protein n=1 Tax=Pseudomonas synxantha TaxID=47883 RepID=UPI001C3F8B08